MRWERLMAYFCGFLFGISSILAIADALSGQEYILRADRAVVAFVAWLGWLSALRWREAAETKDASLAQIKQNWTAP